MTLIILLVFVGVFGVVVLIAAASGSGATEQTRAMMTRLESAIAVGKPEMAELVVDVRKNELMSSIPWLDRYLGKLELTPRIRRFLAQANVKWTVGGLFLACAASFVIPAYLVYWRTGAIGVSLIIGCVCGSGPFMYVYQMRKRRLGKFEPVGGLSRVVSAIHVSDAMPRLPRQTASAGEPGGEGGRSFDC